MDGYPEIGKYFAFHNAYDIQLMKAAVNDLDKAVIYKIGTMQSDWIIERGNSSAPIGRYKQGYIWLKYKDELSGEFYCSLLHLRVIQDYLGKGIYGPAYARLMNSELCGCPK